MTHSCSIKHTKPKFVIKENRSEVRFSNPSRYEVEEVKVDGCLVTEGIRCDYLVDVPACGKAYLVELKGSDLGHALNQIRETFSQVGSRYPRVFTWVICPVKTHPQFNTTIQSERLKLRRQGIELLSKNSPIEIGI